MSPTDTLQGVLLCYSIIMVYLFQKHLFSGSNLRLAPDRRVVPLQHSKARKPKEGPKKTANHHISHFVSSVEANDNLIRKEAEAYLMTSD